MVLSRPATLMSGITLLAVPSAVLSSGAKWLARISAPAAAIMMSGGFFGLAFIPAFRWLLYLGAVALALALIVSGVGLIRRPVRQETGSAPGWVSRAKD